jgi:hypothetical protein
MPEVVKKRPVRKAVCTGILPAATEKSGRVRFFQEAWISIPPLAA